MSSGSGRPRHPAPSVLEMLFEALGEGIMVLDENDRVVYFNPAFRRLRGLDPEIHLDGLHIDELIAAATPFRDHGNPSAPFLRPSAPNLIDYREFSVCIEQFDGVILNVSGRKLDSTHYAVHYTDITESERAAAATREVAALHSTTLNNLMDGIITIDERGVIESFSSGAARLFGYAAAEVVGRNVKVLMPTEHAVLHDSYLSRYSSERVSEVLSTRREVQARRKDGVLVPIELAVSETQVNGRSRFVGVLRDISERQRHERLQHELVSTTSHELRTPLTSIVGSLGLLRNGRAGELPPSAQHIVEIAQRNGERLARLVDDLLDLEKSDSGQFELSHELLRLGTIARETIEGNLAFAERYGVQLELVAGGDDPPCLADRARLQQALTNLVSNAVKFSPKGAIVQVGFDRQVDTGVLWVQDHGPGIPESFRQQLFERFCQADASDARHRGGTGLGLNISKALVEKMGGHIEVDSVQGHGATFRIRLPVCEKALLEA